MSAIDRLSTIIGTVLRRRGLAQHAEAALTILRANEWLTAHLPSRSCEATSLKDGTLTVVCTHAIILQELQGQMPEFRQWLAKECSSSRIGDIRLTQGVLRAGNALAPEIGPA